MSWFHRGLSSKTLLGRVIRLPLLVLPKSMVVRPLFGPLKGSKWIVGSGDHGCWLGIYEKSQSKKFTKVIKSLPENSIFYDIGANVGYYSLLAASLNKKIKVYAFEPSETVNVLLKKHLELNNIKSVFVLGFAVGEKNQDVYFNPGVTSTMGFVTANPSIAQLMVKQVSVDQWRKENNILPPNLIKMDIEGAEFEALLGMRETLVTFRPKILLSTHGDDIRINCEKFLSSLGYTIDYMDPDNQSDFFAA